MLLTVFLAPVFSGAITLLLVSAIAFVQAISMISSFKLSHFRFLLKVWNPSRTGSSPVTSASRQVRFITSDFV